MIQCAIPAFEGLLPSPHDARLMKLLYQTAKWHALAKLQMHSESTLQLLEELTREFGKLMHQFQDQSCSMFATVELVHEKAAWAQVASRSNAKGKRKQSNTQESRFIYLFKYLSNLNALKVPVDLVVRSQSL